MENALIHYIRQHYTDTYKKGNRHYENYRVEGGTRTCDVPLNAGAVLTP